MHSTASPRTTAAVRGTCYATRRAAIPTSGQRNYACANSLRRRPMREPFVFLVFGEAQPQGSARAFVPNGHSRPIITSDNPQLKSWRMLVAESANEALRRLPVHEREYFDAGVRL